HLLRAVRPRLALISCELDNLYGHPAAEILERLRDHSIHTARTDLEGSVRIVPGGEAVTISSRHGIRSLSLTRRVRSF
ncbi:MAG: hypothetical protein R3338_03220, partial [Thermoanaerobaculia bacterium]|nr:hypothetical protein [Thermoanaerobaculia bacterium]